MGGLQLWIFLPPPLYSVLCNCVLTPGEDSHELSRLKAFTKTYKVRQRGAPSYAFLLLRSSYFSPEPPLGRGSIMEV